MNKIIAFVLFLCTVSSSNLLAQDRQEMSNMSVTIESDEYRNARKMDFIKEKKRSYIFGKSSAYKRNDTKPLSKLASPYAEFPIKSGLSGGTYRVTVTYRIAKDAPKMDKQIIYLGYDEQPTEELELKKTGSAIHTVSADFKGEFLRGKNHLVKIWLPTEGVQIDKITVRRKVIK